MERYIILIFAGCLQFFVENFVWRRAPINPKILHKEALDPLLALIPKGPRETEEVPINSAVERVLSEEVVAIMDDPPYSRATSDGYVLLASGTALASPKRPMTFQIEGDIPSPAKSVELPFGKALSVKDGSYMSIKRFLEGHYAVLKESEVRVIEDKLSVTRWVNKHENILVQGYIHKVGHTLFPKGHRIRSKDLFVLASQGILKVKVAKPPKVAVFSSGDDLLPPTEPHRVGYKYDGNAYGLSAMIKEIGGLPTFHGIMPNKLPPFIKKLMQTIKEDAVDLVVISRGISTTEWKFTVDLIQGAAVAGLTDSTEIANAIKRAVIAADPIKPNLMGMIGETPVICLAEQPEQAIRGFRLFARPVFSHLLGEEKRSVSEWSRTDRRGETL